MSYARQMLDTYSRTFNVDAGVLAAAIDALSDCVQACNADNAADLDYAAPGARGSAGLRRASSRPLTGRPVPGHRDVSRSWS